MQTPLGVGEAVLDQDVELRVDEVVDVGFAVELLTGGLYHGQLHLPDWHTPSLQKLGPPPHFPFMSQQSPHLLGHSLLPPQVPSVLQTASPSQIPS